jgi:hypothetical protein
VFIGRARPLPLARRERASSDAVREGGEMEDFGMNLGGWKAGSLEGMA